MKAKKIGGLKPTLTFPRRIVASTPARRYDGWGTLEELHHHPKDVPVLAEFSKFDFLFSKKGKIALLWVYQDPAWPEPRVYEAPLDLSSEDALVLIKAAELDAEKQLTRLRKIVDVSEKLKSATRRKTIPEDVQLFVWQRDGGKCVKCGSAESLEFDHIIPVSKGGANTARNIQLLCEQCNRSKSGKIGG